jgi:trk system potassium uptake protein TrkH
MTNPVDAFFETVSGFTTTGATVTGEILGVFPEDFDRGIALWRSLTHWIGGMGVLVFVLAVMPQEEFKGARLMHAMRAEVPGPVATKVVATIRRSAVIMYTIYVALTLIQIVFLLFGQMSFYDALLHTFSTAGTGGFSNMNASIGAFDSSYIHWVITVFMLLFSLNFNIYYLCITRQLLRALGSEELRWFLAFAIGSIAVITLNIAPLYDSVGIALRDAAFQTASFISTTGFVTANYDVWPTLSKGILVLLMFVGGCAGSTAGGLKIHRLIILIKSAGREIRALVFPHQVRPVRFEERPVEEDTVRGANGYFVLYFLIFTGSILLVLSSGQDLITSFTAVASCLNNVGPGMGEVLGVTGGGSFGGFALWTKLLLAFNMLLGRLELFPILVLFYPTVWKGKKKQKKNEKSQKHY